MAKSLNRVMLIGRVGKDPEARQTGSGKVVTTLSLATSESYKSNDEWKTLTEWHRVVAWGRLAEIINEYIHKSDQIFIEGKLQTREWEDTNGEARKTTEILARDIILLGSKETNKRQNGPAARPKQQNPGPSSGGSDQYYPPQAEPDDIPF